MIDTSKLSPEEIAKRERFDAGYISGQAPVFLSIERSVCGCDYGGNSWTTCAEADEKVSHLNLVRGQRLIDIGAGTGWPGIYMTHVSGCDTVLTDLSSTGLGIAEERVRKDGISKKVTIANADAAALPFSSGSFDAICHSDTLCCLRRKRAVLTECRRLIRQNGRMVFAVICIAPGLSPRDHERAIANGPEFVESDTDYDMLLKQTAWSVIQNEDVTPGFAASCRRQLEADNINRDELEVQIGCQESELRLAKWQSKIIAIKDGLLVRNLFIAKPEMGSS
ncbi:MAG: class I SAM-dependent methyltransferase [Paracoccaceae bacterium]